MTMAVLRNRRAMAARGFLAQNIVNGCAFGGFTVAMPHLRDYYQIGTGTATLCLSLVILASGLSTPLAAAMVHRLGLRWTMLLGGLLTTIGYFLLALTPPIKLVLISYGLFIGLGVAMAGTFTANVLTAKWFQPHPGKAIGFINMPLGVALLPIVMHTVLKSYGLQGFYLTFAGLGALLILLAWGVDEPQRDQQQNSAGELPSAQMLTMSGLLRRPSFWTVALGAGALFAVSLVAVSHIVAFGLERGKPEALAALMASILGSAAMAGSLLSGMLCDRIGGGRTLALIGACYCASWIMLLTSSSTALMVLAVFILGACAGGIYTAVNVLANALYGPVTLARALGLFTLLTLPLTFFVPPSMGVLHDWVNSYEPVAMIMILICAVVAIIFYILARNIDRHQMSRRALAAGI